MSNACLQTSQLYSSAASLRPIHFAFGKNSMSVRSWQAIALCLFLAFGLVGCSGHYRFNDHEYRPLGEPLPANRGK